VANSRPRIIFANMTNELMLEVPSAGHARSLHAVSPRKIWLARAGDLVVTPRPIDHGFKDYACNVLEIDPRSVETVSPDSPVETKLADAVRTADSLQSLRSWIRGHDGAELLPFALDRPTVRLAEDLRVPIHGYQPRPAEEVCDLVYQLNRKSGFRRLAAELGISTVPGVRCTGFEELVFAVRQRLEEGWTVLVKLDRGSNGYGHLVVRPQDPAATSLRAHLAAGIERFSEQPKAFVVERFLTFSNVPSIEILVTDAGCQLLYICDMRCPNGSFSGMITPAEGLPPRVVPELIEAGRRYGNSLHRSGFRGIFDLDAGVTSEGQVFITESNLRRTGGTYLHTLLRRLVGHQYLETHTWLADSRPGRTDRDFASAVAILDKENMAFTRSRREGILLTADTLAIDGRWRYLIISQSSQGVRELETRLESLLGLTWA
jgi:hypothetical protein